MHHKLYFLLAATRKEGKEKREGFYISKFRTEILWEESSLNLQHGAAYKSVSDKAINDIEM
jgi:hypothetical protein